MDASPLPSVLPVPVFNRLPRPASDDGTWERYPFNHPLFIMFSSGTTGRPSASCTAPAARCSSTLKEHQLHSDLGPGDKLYFHTPPPG